MDRTSHLLFNTTLMDESGQLLQEQAIVIKEGRIIWCGSYKTLPDAYVAWPNAKDCQGKLITPGLIDCHTHLVYAGNRALEFQQKLEGKSYAEIARAGGGILSTVLQTREASEERLYEESLPRLLALKKEGVTTVEIKSGYGLDLETEKKILHVAKKLGQETGLRVQKTFLGAHAVAPEYKTKPQSYVDLLCDEILPSLHAEDLVDAVDVFCESIAFSLTQTEQIFKKAQALKLPIKCHAEQLSNLGASALAASLNALSCEHLEFLDEKGADAMAKAGTVAVLLPGAYYFLRETQKPPVDLLRKLDVKIAIASDCNPGSSPTASLRLMMSMACQFFALSVPEALMGVTSHAAMALGLQKQVGKIEKGFIADLVLWSEAEPASLCYYFAYPLSQQTMIAGQWL